MSGKRRKLLELELISWVNEIFLQAYRNRIIAFQLLHCTRSWPKSFSGVVYQCGRLEAELTIGKYLNGTFNQVNKEIGA